MRVLFSILMCAFMAIGQRISGELRLQITDATGGGLRATGRIVGEATGIDRSFETNEDGRFAVRALPLGHYELALRRDGFAAKTVLVDIESQLPIEQRITLEITPITTMVEVVEETLLNPIESAQFLDHQLLAEHTSTAANRSVIDLVNTQPGWLLEANGSLHPRGSEYDVQYVVDGVPLYDNRSPAFARSVNIEDFESLNVRTSGYPAEFGLKLGGVVETVSNQDFNQGLHGALSYNDGGFNNRGGFLSLRYSRGNTSLGFAGDLMRTDRYLDAPVEQNYTNRASGGGSSATFERQWSSADHTRISIDNRATKFMVPNELLQQLAGQRQDRTGGETLAQLSHTHIFSPEILAQARAMTRTTNTRLWANPLSTPIRPSQNSGLRETYVAGSVSAHYRRHELKAGGEGWFSSVHEDVGFHIVSYRIGTVRIFDRDLPADFHFSQRRPGRTQSAFVQDSWHIGNLNVGIGLRADRYRLVASDHAFSPRLGISYDVPRADLVLRGSYDRVFQIPSIENILLASSNPIRDLGGEGTFLPLLPSRGDFGEAGFSKTVSSHVRIDGNAYRRRFDNFADDSLLLNTGVSFPIAFSEANVHGFEGKIDVRNLGRFSGQASYSNMTGTGKLPVAGGLFLGDEAEELLQSGATFPISQDQRNTLRARLRFQPHRRFWFAFAGSYNSGLPFEIEGASDETFVTQQYGEPILERVDFARGRVRPSSSLDASAGIELFGSNEAKLRLQADVLNLSNRLNLINFAGVFSGTALASPRTFSVRLRADF